MYLIKHAQHNAIDSIVYKLSMDKRILMYEYILPFDIHIHDVAMMEMHKLKLRSCNGTLPPSTPTRSSTG